MNRAPWWRTAVSALAIAGAVWAIVWVVGQPNRLAPLGVPINVGPTVTPALIGSGPSLVGISQRAQDEGTVRVYWPGGLSEDWRQRFEAGYQREFGLTTKLQVDAPGVPSADIAATNDAVRAGQPPQWDAFLGSEPDFARLAGDELLRPREWEALFGVSKQAVLFNGGAVSLAQQILQPAYSAKVAPPSGWQGLLDARWKGRIGVANNADVWVTLSAAWGDERVTNFLQRLAGQAPVVAAPDDVERRLEQGGLDIVAAEPATLAGSGVVPADVDPPVLRSRLAATLENARHPNAAILFDGFLLTQEGQKLWQEYSGESSIYTTGSAYQQALADKTYALADAGLLLGEWPARQAKYGHILGM